MSELHELLNKDELLELRRSEEAAFQEIAAKHNERMKKIDLVLSMLENDETVAALGNVMSMLNSPRSNGRALSASSGVRAIVEEWKDDSTITQTEVTARLAEKYPERRNKSIVSLVSNALRELTRGDDAILELVRKGAGSRPAEYRKKV